MLNRISESVDKAMAQIEPIELYKTRFKTSGIQKNKWRKYGQEWFNKDAKFVLAKSIFTTFAIFF